MRHKKMRKLMIVLAVVVVMVPLLAGVALAYDDRIIQCNSKPCYGTKKSDKILERIGEGKPDTILARGANDLVRANKYTDDRDVVKSGGGFDTVNVADGDRRDKARPALGLNKCIVDARKEAGAGCAKVVVR
jgi:hypothetical protein